MTNPIRLEGMLEEVASATSLVELKEIWCINQEANECPPEVTPLYREAVRRLRNKPEEVDLEAKVRELEAQLAALTSTAAKPVVERAKVVRPGKRFRLRDTNVSWSGAGQVAAIMAIVEAHVQVGEVFDEDDIVAAMEANPHVLQTSQPAKKVWAYYRGKHERGLELHGNIEEV